ncbi:MAG: hypothetical protein GC149_07615 [Gammaproteobacteria bacterium]|nr:hypothetical protein [Gammaproteobacteria bacterium]
MNTMIGYTATPEVDDSGKLLQSLLLLARNFLGQTDSGIQRRHAWDAQQFMHNVPPRVWRRHSALLTMLVQQANADDAKVCDAE